MRLALRLVALAVVCGAATSVAASESVTYSYDKQGRLIKSSYAGGPNNGVIIGESYDKTGNRIRYTITGDKSKMIVVPINGLTVIPLIQ